MGVSWPILVLIGVTLVMTFIATRRRFGRYVYAYGGNPDAADLAGINTRWTIMKTFMLMGVLCAISASILVRPSQRRRAGPGLDRRALRHRRGGRRRDLVRRRHRDHPGRRPRRVRDAGAGVWPGLHERALAGAGHRGRRRARGRRGLRHVESPPGWRPGRTLDERAAARPAGRDA